MSAALKLKTISSDHTIALKALDIAKKIDALKAELAPLTEHFRTVFGEGETITIEGKGKIKIAKATAGKTTPTLIVNAEVWEAGVPAAMKKKLMSMTAIQLIDKVTAARKSAVTYTPNV